VYGASDVAAVYLGGVPVADWSVSAGYAPAITFTTAPASGVAISADFGVLWLCRIAEDTIHRVAYGLKAGDLLRETDRAHGARGSGSNQYRKEVASPSTRPPKLSDHGITHRAATLATTAAHDPT
jgi:hypothetical protein